MRVFDWLALLELQVDTWCRARWQEGCGCRGLLIGRLGALCGDRCLLIELSRLDQCLRLEVALFEGLEWEGLAVFALLVLDLAVAIRIERSIYLLLLR